MNIDVHVPDEALAKLADLIVERLAEHRDEQLGAFLEGKPSPGYPAPAEPPTVVDPDPIHAPVPVTIDQIRKVLATMDRGKAVALLQKHGASKLSDLPVDKYADLMGDVA